MDNDIVAEGNLTNPIYERIGGWLIVVVLLLIFNTFQSIIYIFRIFMFLAIDWDFSIFTIQGKILNGFLPELGFEFFGYIVFFLFQIVILNRFFRKKKEVPKMIVIYYVTSLFFHFIDYINAGVLPNLDNYKNSYFVGFIFGNILFCLIWIIYFALSKRVKATFVN